MSHDIYEDEDWCESCKVGHDWSGRTHADWSSCCSCGCRCPVGPPEKKEESYNFPKTDTW